MNSYTYFFTLILIFFYIKVAFSDQSVKLDSAAYQLSVPKILDLEDKKLYLKIRLLQIEGNWSEVDKKVKLLKDKILLGHIDYDKLMHPNKYKSSFDELSEWLIKYNDFPIVMQRRVYSLMMKRSSDAKKINNIKKPKYGNYLRGYGENTKSYTWTAAKGKKNVKTYKNKNLNNLILNREYKKLLNLYKSNQIGKANFIHYLNNEAEKNFFKGNILQAYDIYKFLISEIKTEEPITYFRAGLSAFRLKNLKEGLRHFQDCTSIIKNSKIKFTPKLISACSYWQGRLTSNKNKQNSAFMNAAEHTRTMYGQLAIEKLNKEDGFIWNADNYLHKDKKTNNIINLQTFRRLIALSELNFYDKADLEMRNLYSKLETTVNNTKLLLHLSEKLDLAAVQIRLGETFYKKDYSLYMRGMYPTPAWALREDFIFDKAFIYAIIRRESAFNFRAKSSKGARGLMQLMPRTASKIKKDHRLRYASKHHLYSLNLNLELGQKLLKELIHNRNIKNSILDTLIGYNAGITRVKKWNKNINESDPLAFIESIPIRETRMFIKSILTDLWIYRDKLGQNKLTRSMLANDKWPNIPTQDFHLLRDAKLR